jgi:hypothetical protein
MIFDTAVCKLVWDYTCTFAYVVDTRRRLFQSSFSRTSLSSFIQARSWHQTRKVIVPNPLFLDTNYILELMHHCFYVYVMFLLWSIHSWGCLSVWTVLSGLLCGMWATKPEIVCVNCAPWARLYEHCIMCVLIDRDIWLFWREEKTDFRMKCCKCASSSMYMRMLPVVQSREIHYVCLDLAVFLNVRTIGIEVICMLLRVAK